MILTPDLGQKIIRETTKLIDENIIILNEKAIIIASTDLSRIGDFHEGALLTIKDNTTTILTMEDVVKLKGTKPGVNLPIVFENNVIGVIGITGNPDDITPFASLLKRMTELLIRENYYVRQVEWQARSIEAYFFDWIQMDQVTTNFINRGKLLGINPTLPMRCSIISIQNKTIQNEKINEVIHLISLRMNCNALRWGDKRILILTEEKDIPLNQLIYHMNAIYNYVASTLTLTIAIGIGTIVNSHRIKDSYENALKALTIGRGNKITAYEDLLLEICLNEVSETIRIDFTNRVFKDLVQDRELLHTLKVYLMNNLQIKQTALDLHIHINTLHYRLNRIEEVTGLNPRDTYSIVLFYSGLYLLDNHTK